MKQILLGVTLAIGLGTQSTLAKQEDNICQFSSDSSITYLVDKIISRKNGNYLDSILSTCSSEVKEKVIKNIDADFLKENVSEISKQKIVSFIEQVQAIVNIVNSLSQENKEYFFQTLFGGWYKDKGVIYGISWGSDYFFTALNALKFINDNPNAIEKVSNENWIRFSQEKSTDGLIHLDREITMLRLTGSMERFKNLDPNSINSK